MSPSRPAIVAVASGKGGAGKTTVAVHLALASSRSARTLLEHGAGTGAAAFLADKGVGCVLAPEVGPKAAEALASAGIDIGRVDAGMALDAAIADSIRTGE